MSDTHDLIDALTHDASQRPMLPAPGALYLTVLALCAVYGTSVATILGLRHDLAAFISQPLVIAELGLMLAILASSLRSSIYLIYPDQYQQPLWNKLPLILQGLLLGILSVQINHTDTSQFLANMPHHVECFSCIVIATMLPATALLLLTRRGATTAPLQSGFYVMVTAASIGCIALRCSEVTHDMLHLILSHYLPIIVSSLLGVLLGRTLLRW